MQKERLRAEGTFYGRGWRGGGAVDRRSAATRTMQRQRNPGKPTPLHTQRDTPIKTTLLYIKSGFLFVYVEKKADKVSANITAMLLEREHKDDGCICNQIS